MAINRALKIAILDHGTTQIALARAVGISEPRMSRIMRGHDEPTEDEKKAIAKILRRKVHELFSEVAA